MKFNIHQFDAQSKARAGSIETERGTINTPIFMPVGTAATVKGVHQQELHNPIKAQIILANTYHLYLRPKMDIITQAGGVHKFMNWDKPMLTDSGGYQVYSLSNMRKLNEQGATFKSHIDGSSHTFTPESVMDIQRQIGADFIMAFDECTPYPCEYKYAENSMHLTHRWLERCIKRFKETEPLYGFEQQLLPIVQGSVYEDLRKRSAEYVANTDCFANAIGGLSVGEPAEELYKMTDIVTNYLPKEKARYLMGVGTPENLLECIALGIDMFDCVLPTRNGRHGLIYTQEGIINTKNKKWENDFSALDADLDCPTSNNHSKAYVRHLIHTGELLGAQITSIHNLTFFLWLVGEARNQILKGTFIDWKNNMVKKLRTRL